MADEARHFIVPEGQELAFAEALAGPVIQLEPVCPMCGHVGAVRVDIDRETGERFEIDCYLSWCGAHGVTPAVKRHEDMPPFRMIPDPDGRAGRVSAYANGGVRCRGCGYGSPASAFCRPTGPEAQL